MKTDAELRHDVENELEFDPSVNPTNSTVSVRDGIVTLSGFVDSYPEKWAAVRAAQRVYGVISVIDELEVQLPAEVTYSDEEIARAANEALQRHAFIPRDQVRAVVNNGWVTLEGEVDWQFQQQAAEDAVRYLPGVKGVTNLSIVRPQIAPSDIKQRIADAFQRDAQLDAEQIHIEIHDSTVTLTGNVRSWAERQEAERAAWAAPGITSVEDRIIVRP